ncbi:hypothetical protein D3C84_961710 [compost metagenome]
MRKTTEFARLIRRRCKGHQVGRLGVIKLRQIELRVGHGKLIRHTARHNLPAILDHSHLQIAELQDVGLFVVELERDQAIELG